MGEGIITPGENGGTPAGEPDGEKLVDFQQERLTEKLHTVVNEQVETWMERNMKLAIPEDQHGLIEHAVSNNDHEVLRDLMMGHGLVVTAHSDGHGYDMRRKNRPDKIAEIRFNIEERDGELHIEATRIDVDGPYDPEGEHPLEREVHER